MQLLAHPTTPAGPVSRIDADASRDGSWLHLSWTLDAETSRLRLPPAIAPVRADGLWRHTCFEAFLRAPGAPGYCEINFAPSGAWAAYRFAGYRAGMKPIALPGRPAARWHRTEARLALEVAIAVADLDALLEGSGLRVGLAAVIEDDAGTLSYWALRHPPGRPDFHHLEGFALALESGTAGEAAVPA